MLQRFLNVCKQTETSSEKSDRHPKKVEGSRAFEGIRIHRMPKQAWTFLSQALLLRAGFEAFFQIPESTVTGSFCSYFRHKQCEVSCVITCAVPLGKGFP